MDLNLESPAPKSWLVQNIGSRHLGNRDLNENNPGIGLEMELSKKLAAALGQYRNSYNQNSTYAGVQYTPVEMGNWKLGGMAGAVTGYDMAPVLPMVGGIAKYDGGDFGANLMLAPGAKLRNSFIGLQLKQRFK